MYKKDNYNQIYNQLISQNFLETLGNATINAGKATGNIIGKIWKGGHKYFTNRKIKENLTKIIEDNTKTYQNIINNFLNIIPANYTINIDENNIQLLQKEYSNIFKNIQSEFEKNKFLLENNISNINNILPQSLLKSYLIEIQKLGEKTGKFILTLNFNKDTDNKQDIIKNFIKQQQNILIINLQNKYLQSTISENTLYNIVYQQLLKQDIFDPVISVSGNKNQKSNIKLHQILATNNKNNNEKTINAIDNKKQEENNKIIDTIKLNFSLNISKIQFYFNIISNKDISNNLINTSKIIKKILKQLNKKYNIKITQEQLKKLSALYFIYGLIIVFQMPTFEINKK